MEIIELDEGTCIYKTTFNNQVNEETILKDIDQFFKIATYSPQDNYPYLNPISVFDFKNILQINNNIDLVIKLAVEECINLEKLRNQKFNKINVDSWINVVRSKNPKQIDYKKNGDVTLHNHIDIQNNIESFYPNYTFVYYVQMPNNLKEHEGMLILGGKRERFYHLPNNGDLIIMEGGLPHSPNISPNSTKDRIVIAGNVGFEYVKTKATFI